MNTSNPFDGFEAGAATLICCSQKLLLVFDESSGRYTVPTCPLTGRELSHADDEPWRAAATRAVQECVDGRISAAPELIAELNIDGRPCQVFQLFVADELHCRCLRYKWATLSEIRDSLYSDVSPLVQRLLANPDVARRLEEPQTRDAPAQPVSTGYGASRSSNAPAPRFRGEEPRDPVRFSAYCPHVVSPGSTFVLKVFAHLKEQSAEVAEIANSRRAVSLAGIASGVLIARGSDITIHVEIERLDVVAPIHVIDWTGDIGIADFVVRVPDDAVTGECIGSVSIVVAGVVKTVFAVQVEVSTAESKDRAAGDVRLLQRKNVRTVFASYSSEDRDAVLQFKLFVESVGVDVFVDVTDLRNGDSWEEQLWQEIPDRDLFCLFWSEPASRSEWVEKEWRAALEAKGCRFIHPIPLVDPRTVPPPGKLAECTHFESMNRIALEYERFWRSTRIR